MRSLLSAITAHRCIGTCHENIHFGLKPFMCLQSPAALSSRSGHRFLNWADSTSKTEICTYQSCLIHRALLSLSAVPLGLARVRDVYNKRNGLHWYLDKLLIESEMNFCFKTNELTAQILFLANQTRISCHPFLFNV